ncbi:MAG: hypothetical protein E6778_23370 [Niallia nealsonii]|nr:hypothetical protein [Niallia nealsonii]
MENEKKEVSMPRPRKYDYQKDYPVKKAIYVKLTVEIEKKLEEMNLQGSELSKIVERFLIDYVEKNSKKD